MNNVREVVEVHQYGGETEAVIVRYIEGESKHSAVADATLATRQCRLSYLLPMAPILIGDFVETAHREHDGSICRRECLAHNLIKDADGVFGDTII